MFIALFFLHYLFTRFYEILIILFLVVFFRDFIDYK